jgi:glucose/arabinose dehydrogenase
MAIRTFELPRLLSSVDMAARFYLLPALVLAAACGRTSPPTPSPPTAPGETITGRERLGWDQQASNGAELATFRYAIYVDGIRSELAEVLCGSAAGAAGFACSGRLPALTNGSHTLELAAFTLDAAGILESARSTPLQVTVSGLVAPPIGSTPLAPGDTIVTADRITLTATQLAAQLEDIVDIAILPDGRPLAAQRTGAIRILSAERTAESGRQTADAVWRTADGDIASLTLDPAFARTGRVFIMHTTSGVFRLGRDRLAETGLVDRTPLLRDVAASADAAAVVRFGPDGKQYVAFDDGGSREAAARASEWNGKILRLNADGTTPDDQPAASPVFWSGLRAPRGLAWTAADGTMWMAEERMDRGDRLSAIGLASTRPRRSTPRGSYPLPQPFGARTLALHPGGDLPDMRGDLLIAANDAGCLLRVRFDAAASSGSAPRVFASERLLEGRIGPVRAAAVAGDGAIYVASDSAVWRLTRADR